MTATHVELSAQGYLQLSAAVAQSYFPHDSLVAQVRGRELWLWPTQGAQAGGLLLKLRNRQGDRTVLIWTELPPQTAPGQHPAFWDARQGALRVALSTRDSLPLSR